MKYSILLIALLMMFVVVQAQPVTLPVTNVSGDYAYFSATGSGSIGQIQWGVMNTGNNIWATPNQSYSGSFNDFQYGPPMLTSTTYYVRACDDTGCGNYVSWTTPAAIPVNQTSYGAQLYGMLHKGMNPWVILSGIASPYTTAMPGGAPIAWGVLFFFVLAGYWLKPKDILIPCLLTFMCGGALWMSGGLGIDPMMMSLGQGLLYASLAGIVVSWFSK